MWKQRKTLNGITLEQRAFDIINWMVTLSKLTEHVNFV
jgi:hypothetical protein